MARLRNFSHMQKRVDLLALSSSLDDPERTQGVIARMGDAGFPVNPIEAVTSGVAWLYAPALLGRESRVDTRITSARSE
jgi:hypothetical protein